MGTKSNIKIEIGSMNFANGRFEFGDLEPFDFGDERTVVESSALAGMSPHEIAQLAKLDIVTLRERHYEELALTPVKGLETVIEKLK